MNLQQWIENLKKTPIRFELIFGVTPTDYVALENNFTLKKFGDRTRPTDNPADKLPMILLCKRFGLNQQEQKAIFFPTKNNKVIENFNNTVGNRFNRVIRSLESPLKANVLAAIKQPALVELLKKAVYPISGLDGFFKYLVGMVAVKSLITHKISNDVNLKIYLARDICEKNKTGQKNYLQLMNCLLFDLQDFHGEREYMVWYFAIVLNIFMHNASHAPNVVCGKSQLRETNHLNYYYRSQYNHPHMLFYRAIAGNGSNKQCIGPRNKMMERLVLASEDGEFVTKLKQYNTLGYNKNDDNNQHFGTKVAHSGLRSNNLSTYILAITSFLNNKAYATSEEAYAAFLAKLKEKDILPKTFEQQMAKCDALTLTRRLKLLEDKFIKLNQAVIKTTYPNLLQESMQRRQKNAASIVEVLVKEELKKIALVYDPNSACLYVDFYPQDDYLHNDNYNIGITNVIIGIFGGLVNCYSAYYNVPLCMQRRQSFGFSHTTVTDAGMMRMRISLGTEPDEYSGILKQSLRDLDNILTEFDFTNAEDPALKAGFVVTERPRGKRETENTGIKFLTVMRPDTNQAAALACATTCFINAKNAGKSQKVAVKNYIDAITNDVFKQVEYHSAELKNKMPVEDKSVSSDQLISLKLLHNTLIYTLHYVQKIQHVQSDLFNYGYWHVLVKLYKNCCKAQALLETLKDRTNYDNYANASLLIDNLLEYLLVLDGLQMLRDQSMSQTNDPVKKLTDMETAYVKNKLNLANSPSVYFTDSGQQAMTNSLYVMSMYLTQNHDPAQLSESVYIDHKCYYELSKFLTEDLKIEVAAAPENARMLFLDITGLSRYIKQPSYFSNASVVILDITHDPTLSAIGLKSFIANLRQKNIVVALVNSMLKHEQLGLDKYQAGKVTLITPDDQPLPVNIQDELSKISQASMQPLVASFHLMVNEICGDKLNKPAPVKTSTLFKPKQTNKKAEEKPKNSMRAAC